MDWRRELDPENMAAPTTHFDPHLAAVAEALAIGERSGWDVLPKVRLSPCSRECPTPTPLLLRLLLLSMMTTTDLKEASSHT